MLTVHCSFQRVVCQWSVQISDDSTFNVLQLNTNGTGNKQTRTRSITGEKQCKVAVTQEPKRKDRPRGHVRE